MTAALAPSMSARPATPTPSGVSIASAWNVSAVPPPSAAAHTATAVPLSISRPPPRTARARVPASMAATRGSEPCDSPQPMRTLTVRTILRGMGRDAAVLAVFGPTGIGKTALALALPERLRARGERPVAVSADALQVYRGLETLTGVATPAEQAQLEHRLVSFLPIDATFSVGQYAELAH